MENFFSPLLGILYPAFCRHCGGGLGAGERFFCGRCLSSVRVIDGPVCTTCGRVFDGAGEGHDCSECLSERPPFDMARAHAVYDGAVKEAIHLYKYRPLRSLKGYLGGLVALEAAKWYNVADIAVPVPLHKKRLRQRGFNQSLFLADSAARAAGARLSIDGLIRTRYTRPQVDLGPGEREENVKGAFLVVRPEEFRGRKVLLVDDVHTTGATVKECSRVLKKAGADAVFVLTVARVVG